MLADLLGAANGTAHSWHKWNGGDRASYVASRLRYGLWDRRGTLLGVAVLSVPVRRAVLTGPFPELEPFQESQELGRFVLADRAPANSESWFLSQLFRLAGREGIRGVVSFSDPVARRDATGRLVFPGHIGVVYQSANAIYAGRGTARTVLVLPDGRVLNERALAKLRALDTGHAYVEDLLRRFGAPPRRGADPAEWLPRPGRRRGAAPPPPRKPPLPVPARRPGGQAVRPRRPAEPAVPEGHGPTDRAGRVSAC